MKYFLFALFIFAAVPAAMAQSDSLAILRAKNAITVTGNCDDALRYLGNISPEGKMTANYFLYMGKANDCKQNNEQALYYYKKYLEFGTANDSIKLRVAQLSDQKAETARVANEQRVARESYQAVAHTKKRKQHKNIDDNFGLIGISYDPALGGANASFKSGISFSGSVNYPVMHNYVTLGYSITSGFLFSPNTNWFANVFSLPQSQVSGVGLGLSEFLSFVPMVVIINKKKLALTAGPEIGIGFFYTPEPSGSFGGSLTFNDDDDFGISYGVKSNLLLGDNTAITAEFTTFSRNYVTSQDGAGTTQTYAVNHNMLHIGIAYRMESWGWW